MTHGATLSDHETHRKHTHSPSNVGAAAQSPPYLPPPPCASPQHRRRPIRRRRARAAHCRHAVASLRSSSGSPREAAERGRRARRSRPPVAARRRLRRARAWHGGCAARPAASQLQRCSTAARPPRALGGREAAPRRASHLIGPSAELRLRRIKVGARDSGRRCSADG